MCHRFWTPGTFHVFTEATSFLSREYRFCKEGSVAKEPGLVEGGQSSFMIGLQATTCQVACRHWPDSVQAHTEACHHHVRPFTTTTAKFSGHLDLSNSPTSLPNSRRRCLLRPAHVTERHHASDVFRFERRMRCAAEGGGGDIAAPLQQSERGASGETSAPDGPPPEEGEPDDAELADSSTDDDVAGPTASRRSQGLAISTVLFFVLLFELLLVDSYIWRVVRRPLASFFLTLPFLLSAVFSGYLGCLAVPILRRLKAGQVIREEGPQAHMVKSGTPTMGGLFFIPVGVGVARLTNEFASRELWGVGAATLGFAAIGLLDDSLILLRKSNTGLPGSIKLVLQVALGTWFFFWLSGAGLASPYNMNWLVPLPPPLGLLYIGGLYLPLSVFCFAAMSNGVNLTDGLDGLAAGTCAAAFVGMAVASLPIYPSLGVFGASMAGACVGFLAHNCHKASVFMGDTGSLALGAALAAMAACTGMFMPLVVASGIFVVETVSVVLQVAYFKGTKQVTGTGRRLFRMAPFHHHLELCGVSEPNIIIAAYVVSIILAIIAAHVGLVSA